MGFEDDVPTWFYNWARSYLSGSGYDYKTVDIPAHYDSTLTSQELKSGFKKMYPPQVGTRTGERETVPSQREARDWDQREYEHSVSMRKEQKEEELKEAIESSPYKKEGETPTFVDEYMPPGEESRKQGFVEGVKGRVGEYLDERKRKKAEANRWREIQQKKEIAELDRKIALEKSESVKKDLEAERRRLKLENIKRTFNPLEGVIEKPSTPAQPYQRAPSPAPAPERSRMAEKLDISKSVLERAERRGAAADRFGLDVFGAKAQAVQGGMPQADRFGLNIFGPAKQPQKQKYQYRYVIEKGGVARRERVPITPTPEQAQGAPPAAPGSSFAQRMDLFARGASPPHQSSISPGNGRAKLAEKLELTASHPIDQGKRKPIQFFGGPRAEPPKADFSIKLRPQSAIGPARKKFLGKPKGTPRKKGKGKKKPEGRFGGFL